MILNIRTGCQDWFKFIWEIFRYDVDPGNTSNSSQLPKGELFAYSRYVCYATQTSPSYIDNRLEVNLNNWPQIDFNSTKYQFSNAKKRNWAYSEMIWTMKILRFTGLNSFIRESSKCQGLNQISTRCSFKNLTL